MYKAIIGGLFGAIMFANVAMAANCTAYTYTFSSGTTADASQVNSNFNTIMNCANNNLALATLGTLTSPLFTGSVPSLSNGYGSVVGSSTNGGIFTGQGSTNDVSIENKSGSTVMVVPTGTQNAQFSGSISTSGTITINTAQGIIVAAATPDIALTDSTWGAAAYLQPGVNSAGSGAGNYFLQNVPSGKGFSFAINNASQMVIASTGDVGIGTTSPSYTLHVNGSVAGTSAYVNLSDARLKKNVSSIDNALTIIEQLRGVRFNWREVKERSVGKNFNLPVGDSQVGFVAQDVKKILPEAVTVAKGPDAIMSVAESKVVPVLVEAVKELKAANDNQAAEIGRLQTQMSALQHKVGIQTAEK
jgi:hypothetical protein